MNRWSVLLLVASFTLSAVAQQVIVNRQHAFPASVPAGNYSGITWLGENRYAIVDDKSENAGFWLMTIVMDSISGEILHVQADTFMTSGLPNRDEEGVCYVPSWNTLFISGEADGQIVEYQLDGALTGRRLHIPDVFHSALSNSGFEALTYNAATHRFWTTTENTLPVDGQLPTITNKIQNRLRLQSFDEQLQPAEQYWYESDTSVVTKSKGVSYLGVSGLAALDDGRLVVLEREVYKSHSKIGSFVQVKLYIVHPAKQEQGTLLEKHLLAELRTRINLTARSFANYEGLCVGPRLTDGRQVLLMVADSQNQYRGYLKDWFRTVVFY